MTGKRQVAIALILFALSTCSLTRGAEAIRLQFRPPSGEKQTMRVNSRLATTYPTPAGPDCMEHITNFTVEVEPTAVAGDGTVTLRIGIVGIFLDSHAKNSRLSFLHYDSSRNRDWDPSDACYRALIGESFLVTTSAQGKLLALKADQFFTAAGAQRMALEDKAYRQAPSKRIGEKTIKQLNEQYGSPEKRAQAYTEEAVKSPLYGPDQLRLLASRVLVPLAGEPVKSGATWKGPVMISIECPMELVGTYTLKSTATDVCTIQVQAQRTPEDKPLSSRYPMGSKLPGTYQATVKVDRTTGRLLAREATMHLAGDLFRPGHPAAKPDGAVPVTSEATTTVEMVK